MFIIRKKLSATEGQAPNTRYNPDTGTVQTTYDGGATWVDSPASDPRHGDSFRAPAMGGGSAQCDAAANMRAATRSWVDAHLASVDIVTTVSGVLALILLFMPAIALLWEVLLGVAGLMLELGASAVEAAMTEDVYDELEEIYFCSIDGDGQCDADQLAQIRLRVNADIGGTAATVINLFLDSVGEVGLSNTHLNWDETGDCDDFECRWSRTWQTAEDYAELTIAVGSLVGTTFTAGDVHDGSDVYRYLQVQLPGFNHLVASMDRFQVFYTKTIAGDANLNIDRIYNVSGGGNYITQPSDTTASPFEYDSTPVSVDTVGVLLLCGFTHAGVGGGSVAIEKFHAEGLGVNPWGRPNN